MSAKTNALSIKVLPLPRRSSLGAQAHHVGNPPTSFVNPWPSSGGKQSLLSLFSARFGRSRNFVPVPPVRDELVQIRKPDWGRNKPSKLRATWIGHASFLIETAAGDGAKRGMKILLDPVFAERVGPLGMVGPRRFTPTPCSIEELPEVDAVVISHNHYDHLDIETVKKLYTSRKQDLHFFCGLNTKAWFVASGISEQDVTELDWWDAVELKVSDVGSIKLTCTPSQHGSARSVSDRDCALWCSWVIEELGTQSLRRLYFAGDTGYRAISSEDAGKDESTLSKCPAFAEIGERHGPFDLALLPIGCFKPRTLMSNVHCAPEDSICIHKDIRSKKSLGMHYGAIRGGISAQYEDVRDPPKRWKESCEQAGLKWGEEIILCDVGETVAV